MTLTDEENKQVELGAAAEALMSNEFFGYIMSELGNAYVSGITTSKPEQTTEREGFYHALKALQDVGATLAHWAQVKQQIMRNLEEAETEPEQD